MTPAVKSKPSTIIGMMVLLYIAIIAIAVIVDFFSDLIREDVSFLVYFCATFAAAIAMLVLLYKKRISGRDIVVSVPMTMVLLLLVLTLSCRWWYTPEGLVLASPASLGGFQQWGPALSLKSEIPSKFFELVSKVFSYDSLFGRSVYVRTLFYWPGLVIWFLAMLGLHLLSIRSQKSHQKELEREYSMMLSSIQRMFGIKMDESYLSTHLRQASKFEVAQLIEDNKAKEVERKHAGYFIPPINMFIKISLERRPDLVFYLYKLEMFEKDGVEITPLWDKNKIRPQEFLRKDYYVFKYDSFGIPETHLCARIGYVLYDPDLQDIVAEAFYGKS